MTDSAALETLSLRFDAYGPALSHWPEREAAEARALFARSAEARRIQKQANLLAELVERAAEAEAPNGLAFRIVGEVAARRADRFSWLMGSPGRFGFAGASFCVAALAVGVALGAFAEPQQTGATVANLDLGAAFEVSLVDGDL
ncbi:hypothetical protein [Hansschlegelia plantiphila]|uniref:Uncharacterized protein n=1 Tax=Hansschlegelia plantiphila TaxID=374655 RepID=A0A9W6IZV4_9HYPH|nr:hypothetical protein [Hansschlegelia plantiphila]GLK66719.1 hypothetical protein GCM10008179_03570 [Hansschlegelia plantiphila]